MKNLKKILIALAVVALLVSSLALIVGAEGEYTDLKKLYNKYDAVKITDSPEDQAADLAEAYKMLQTETFDPAGTYEAVLVPDDKETEEDETVKATYTFSDVVAMMNESSLRIGELLYTSVADAEKPEDRVSGIKALFDHLAACPITEGTAGYAELLGKANAKNVEVITEQLGLAKEAEIAVAQKALVEIYNHIAKYGIDETANAKLVADIDDFAADIAEQLYENWSSIPADHVDTNADDKCDYCEAVISAHVDENSDEKCDNCKLEIKDATDEDDSQQLDYCKSTTPATSAHYHARYNGIYAAKYFIASVGMFVNGSVPTTAPQAAKEIVKQCSTMDAEKKAKQIALDAEASFDEYDYGEPYQKIDCENEVFKPINSTAVNYGEVATDPFGNKYFRLVKGTDTTHTYIEPEPGSKDAFRLGMVIEFDMMVEDNFRQSFFMWREPSVKMSNFLKFDSAKRDGVITISNVVPAGSEVESVSVTGAIVPNVWAHLTITYDDESRTGKFYVNYEYICDIAYSEANKFNGLRLGGDGGITDNTIGYDNYSVINGSQYRIWDRFKGWSDAELFNFYVEEMLNEESESLKRNAAYKKAKLLFAAVQNNDACKEAVADYLACDYDNDIKKEAMADNLELLKEHVNKLLEVEINSENTAKVNERITKINEFISKNGELINKGDTSEGGYQSLMMQVNSIKADLVKIENVKAFVEALKKFDRATTLTSMAKYATAAETIYVLAAYDVPANVDFVKGDPAVLAFEQLINGALKPDEEGYVTLFEYYENVAEKVAYRSLYENAKRIISCMNFVTSMEGYEETAKFWGDNAEYISNYVSIARDILVSGDYDTTVEGLDEAIATFHTLDVFFYELLQQQHISAIQEQLDKYVATEAYINKVGVCALVKQYLDENDIAVYNTNMTPEVAASVADEIAKLNELIIIYNVYNDELALQENDYKAVLAQNTQYFINTVNNMSAVLSYVELKPLFDKATGYYYSIDSDGEEASAATEKYIAYREQLEAWETNGAIFVGYVDGLAAAQALSGVEREDAIYAVLVSCMAYVDLVDEGVEGVAEAMADYKAALAAYNAELDIVNTDISESAKITAAVRTRSISNVVLAIISKIFEN